MSRSSPFVLYILFIVVVCYIFVSIYEIAHNPAIRPRHPIVILYYTVYTILILQLALSRGDQRYLPQKPLSRREYMCVCFVCVYFLCRSDCDC